VTGFKLRGPITGIEVIAVGPRVHLLGLHRLYGPGRWRKLKGNGLIELEDGRLVEAELHCTGLTELAGWT